MPQTRVDNPLPFYYPSLFIETFWCVAFGVFKKYLFPCNKLMLLCYDLMRSQYDILFFVCSYDK